MRITADASDRDGGVVSVTFSVNGTFWFMDDQAPYEYTMRNIPYRIGTHRVVAVATDEGNLEAADSIDVSIVSASTPVYGVVVEETYPHDEGAFTQGLVVDEGFLYEGTGMWRQSSIRKVELETGNILMIRRIPDGYFGEGITILGERLYQLTWRKPAIGFIYNKADFDSLGSFGYETEGWGLANDAEHLILSDGTSIIYFLDSTTFSVDRQLEVSDGGVPVTRLNELEYIEGDLFANVWKEDRIARISLKDGNVVGWVDLKDIADSQSRGVLNGIAYDGTRGRLFITGKNWDSIYEIELQF